MKRATLGTWGLVAALSLAGWCYAADPPAAALGGPGGPTTNPARRWAQGRERAAFLGLHVTESSEALQHQLGLVEGTGLVVQQVLPDSAAAAAGLQRYDVLQKLDDQLLVNPRQLAVLVRGHKSGDSVTLTLFRAGKTESVTVKLREAELPPLQGEDRRGGGHAPWRGFPWQGMQGMPWFHGGPGMRDRDEGPAERPVPGRHAAPSAPGESGLAPHSWKAGDDTYTIATRQGHRYLTVERNGQKVFDGLIDTPEQVAKLPPDIHAQVETQE